MKIHPVGAELFYADRQAGRHDEANFEILRRCLKMYPLPETEPLACSPQHRRQ
jgi:hypothetical protein